MSNAFENILFYFKNTRVYISAIAAYKPNGE